MEDPDLEIRGGGGASRPLDKRGAVFKKNFFGPSGLSLVSKDKNNLKAVFCLLELFVYIQLITWTRLSSNAKFGNAQFEPACIETPPRSPLLPLFVEDKST